MFLYLASETAAEMSVKAALSTRISDHMPTYTRVSCPRRQRLPGPLQRNPMQRTVTWTTPHTHLPL